MTFNVWHLSLSIMFSSFIHVVCFCIPETYLCLWLNNIFSLYAVICLSIYPLMDIWTIPLINHSKYILLLRTCKYMYLFAFLTHVTRLLQPPPLILYSFSASRIPSCYPSVVRPFSSS